MAMIHMKISNGLCSIDSDGSFKWDSAVWNANIASYEDVFKADLNDDDYLGVNEDLVLKTVPILSGLSFGIQEQALCTLLMKAIQRMSKTNSG